MPKRKNKRQRSFQRFLRLTILGATWALLIQTFTVAGEGAAARSDDARAVEQGHRSDHAAARSQHAAALKLRIDEMHDRRRGHRLQRQQRRQRLTPNERKRERQPVPLPRPSRDRDLSDAFERVNALRHRLGVPAITVEQ